MTSVCAVGQLQSADDFTFRLGFCSLLELGQQRFGSRVPQTGKLIKLLSESVALSPQPFALGLHLPESASDAIRFVER